MHGRRPLHPGTGKGADIVQVRVEKYWDGDLCKQINKSRPEETQGRLAATSSSPDNRSHVLCRGVNYHPDSGQVFWPTARNAFVMHLALPGDDVKLEDFVAFYFDGSCGFQIKPGKHHNNSTVRHTYVCDAHSSDPPNRRP